jgi:hypothetical protein
MLNIYIYEQYSLKIICQNTLKLKCIVSIKKTEYQLEWNWQPCLEYLVVRIKMINQESNDENKSIGLLDLFF